MKQFDAIIVGAGQAGPALTGRLTGAGMTVALIERSLGAAEAYPTIQRRGEVLRSHHPRTPDQ